MTDKLYCPECGSEEVFSTHEQAFMVNTGEHYFSHMEAGCTACNWQGERRQLATHGITGEKK